MQHTIINITKTKAIESMRAVPTPTIIRVLCEFRAQASLSLSYFHFGCWVLQLGFLLIGSSSINLELSRKYCLRRNPIVC